MSPLASTWCVVAMAACLADADVGKREAGADKVPVRPVRRVEKTYSMPTSSGLAFAKLLQAHLAPEAGVHIVATPVRGKLELRVIAPVATQITIHSFIAMLGGTQRVPKQGTTPPDLEVVKKWIFGHRSPKSDRDDAGSGSG